MKRTASDVSFPVRCRLYTMPYWNIKNLKLKIVSNIRPLNVFICTWRRRSPYETNQKSTTCNKFMIPFASKEFIYTTKHLCHVMQQCFSYNSAIINIKHSLVILRASGVWMRCKGHILGCGKISKEAGRLFLVTLGRHEVSDGSMI